MRIDFKDEILDSLKTMVLDDETDETEHVFLVGGYLRNYFLNGKISFDRDLVCIDSKSLALKIAQKLDGTFIELDSENKIYRVVLKDKKNYFDVSSIPSTTNDDIIKDIKRRDFTINSIFYDIKNNEIIDPLGGIDDIKNKTLKTASLDNFLDDPLRFLRLFRFMSLLGFGADNELLNFTKQNFSLIKKSAKERINYEIIKIFEGDSLSQTLLKMYELGVLEIVFPFVGEIKKIPKNSHHHLDLIHHSIETVKNINSKNPLLRLAALYHDIGKPKTWTIDDTGRHRFISHDIEGEKLVKKELKDLKFSNKQINYVSKLVRYHIYPASLINCNNNTNGDNKNKAFARFVRKMGDETLDVIELARADRLSALGVDVSEKMVQDALNHLENLKKYYLDIKDIVKSPKSMLDGNEIMEILNLKPCKKIGEIMEKLVLAQISGEIRTKDEAREFVKGYEKI